MIEVESRTIGGEIMSGVIAVEFLTTSFSVSLFSDW